MNRAVLPRGCGVNRRLSQAFWPQACCPKPREWAPPAPPRSATPTCQLHASVSQRPGAKNKPHGTQSL